MPLPPALAEKLAARAEAPPPGERRALRRLHHVTTADIAAACDVTPQTIGRWEMHDPIPWTPGGRKYLEVLRELTELGTVPPS